MANTKTTALTALASAGTSDVIPIVDNSGTPTTKKITRANFVGAALDAWSAKTVPTGTVVGTSDSQTLTNKTLTSPIINTPTTAIITSLTVETVIDDADLLMLYDNSAAALRKMTKANFVLGLSAGASDWTTYTAVTPTTGTIDGVTGEFVFAGVDLTSTIYEGMKIRITQSTVKYGIVTKKAFSTNTTLTVYFGTDYTLVASGVTAISAFAYSSARAPSGFPLNPDKWTLTLTDTTSRTQASPVNGTWYNLGSLSLDIHIGIWNTSYSVIGQATGSAVTVVSVSSTLSTANNSESDTGFTDYTELGGASGSVSIYKQNTKSKVLALTTKTTYYLNAKTLNAIATLGHRGDVGGTSIKAICAYL